jgi:hypothetical protein
MGMRQIVLASVAVIAVSVTIAAGAPAATPKGNVGRAFVDAYVQVEEDSNIHTPFPQILGTAHIQVHAYDVDPAHPQSSFEQQSDEVWFSCTPLSGPDPCRAFPQGNVKFVDQYASDAVAISADGGFTFLTLKDGGTPGNGSAGGTTTLGTPITNDRIGWAQPGSGRSWSGYLLSGNVTINY